PHAARSPPPFPTRRPFRSYGWDRIDNLTPDRPAFPLGFGSATHLFLQERRRGMPIADAMKIGLDRLVQNFPKAMFPEDLEELERDRKSTRLNCSHVTI